MEGSIFISYRRGDGPGFAGRLYDRLEREFSADRLFFDVDNIAPGLDFVQVLHDKVAACDVLLAIIGRGWADARDGNGDLRLHSPDDFVRVEIEQALAQKKRVIPVLVDGAEMPRRTQLPESLQPLLRRNAVRLSHEGFRSDVERLVNALREALADLGKRLEGQGGAPDGGAPDIPSPEAKAQMALDEWGEFLDKAVAKAGGIPVSTPRSEVASATDRLAQLEALYGKAAAKSMFEAEQAASGPLKAAPSVSDSSDATAGKGGRKTPRH